MVILHGFQCLETVAGSQGAMSHWEVLDFLSHAACGDPQPAGAEGLWLMLFCAAQTAFGRPSPLVSSYQMPHEGPPGGPSKLGPTIRLELKTSGWAANAAKSEAPVSPTRESFDSGAFGTWHVLGPS